MRERVFFPNLNSVRFIAAAMVVLHHCEQFKGIFGYANAYRDPAIHQLGRLGVILFFVLSGFLITYLLLEEKKIRGRINVRFFYARRVLRIWPLYYLLVVAGFFLLPLFEPLYGLTGTAPVHENFYTKLFLFVFFLPNVATFFLSPVTFVSHGWSIGVEEQFYAFWPLVVKYARRTVAALVTVIGVYLTISLALRAWRFYNPTLEMLTTAIEFWDAFSISSMAIGGLYAYALHARLNLLSMLFGRWLQIATTVVTIALVSLGFRFPAFNHECYALLFGCVLLNLAANPRRVLSLEWKPLSYLGKISYGLYMYHPLVIGVTIAMAPQVVSNSFLLFATALAATACVAALSYELYEKRFIRMKLHYSTVVSGDNALNSDAKQAR